MAASIEAPFSQQEMIFVVLQKLYKEAEIEEKAQIPLIFCGRGPGSYTSTRIGVTAARGISQATGAMIYPLDSLRIIARSFWLLNSCAYRRCLVIRDAKMKQLYFLGFSSLDEFSAPEESSIGNIEEIREIAESKGVELIVTDTPEVIKNFELKRVEVFVQIPEVIGLISEAMFAFRNRAPVEWQDLHPQYLRLSYAEQNKPQ